MTNEQMKEEHRRMIVRGRLSKYHADLSIEYAISVLEEIKSQKTTEATLLALSHKIEELRKLITV